MDIVLASYLLLSFGAVQGIILSLYLLGKGRRSANFLLGFVLMVFSINMLIAPLLYYFYSHFHFLLGLGFPLMFLFGPGIYFYTLIQSGRRERLRIKDSLHLLPFAMSIVITLPLAALPVEVKVGLLQDWQQGNLPSSILIGWAVECIHLVIYMFGTFHLLVKHETKLKRKYSTIERINLGWLKRLVIGKSVIWLIYCLLLVGFLTGLDQLSFNTIFLLFALTVSLLTYYIGYCGLRQPAIFSVVGEMTPVAKYEKSGLNEEMMATYLRQLDHLMEKDEVYLDPEISLSSLAQKLDMPTNYLSQVINERKGANFFDYINGLRIDQAKKILEDPAQKKIPIIQMAYSLGYNSKSTFNTAFRKFTGHTPTAYRALHDREKLTFSREPLRS